MNRSFTDVISVSLMENRFISFFIFMLHLMIASHFASTTRVKVFQYKQVNDGSMTEWSDDFPTLARIEFILPRPLNLRIYCGFAVGCDEVPAASLNVCYRGSGDDQNCVTVGSEKTSATLPGIGIKAVYDKEKHEVVATLDNVPKNHVLSVFELFCESSTELGSVQRKGNHLLVLDHRDFFTKWSPREADYDLNKNADNYVSCWPPKIISMEALQRSTFPFVSPAVEWFACSSTDWKACHADKNNDVNRMKSFLKWPTTITTSKLSLKLFFEAPTESVMSKLQGKYLTCFINGEVAMSPEKKITFKDGPKKNVKQMKLYVPSKTGSTHVMWNDSSVTILYLMFSRPSDPSDELESIQWTYTGSAGKIVLKNGERNEKLKVKVWREGQRLIFTGPYPAATNGKYTVEVKTKATQVTGFYTIQVFAYPYPGAKFTKTVVTFDTNVQLSCYPIVSTVPLFSLGYVFNASQIKYVTIMTTWVSEEKTSMEYQFSVKCNRLVTVNNELNHIGDHSFTNLTERGFGYIPQKSNCHTVTCQSIPKSAIHTIAYDYNHPAPRILLFQTIRIIALSADKLEPELHLITTDCINFCEVVCNFKGIKKLIKHGVIFEREWEANDETTKGETFRFIPPPIPKVKCTIRMLQPGSLKILWTRDVTKDYRGMHITITYKSDALRNIQTNFILILFSAGLITKMLMFGIKG